MNIGIDISKIGKENLSKHKIRGSGSYIDGLIEHVPKIDRNNKYIIIDGEVRLTEIDVFHYPYFEPFFLSLPVRVNKPSVVTVHDLIPLVFPDKFPAGIKGKLRWRVQKLALANKTLIVTDSQASRKDIIKIAGIKEAKIRVVYLAASETFTKLPDSLRLEKKREIVKKYSLPENFLLYVGDATWNKNLVGIANSIKRTDTKIVMVGKALVRNHYDKGNLWNNELLEFQRITENDKRFYLTGFVDQKDLNSLYNLARALIMPSFYEGFGLPVLEAMQAGCPVITSNKGSLKEVGGEAVYYVDPYSIDSISEGIEQLINNEMLRNSLSEKGLIQAKKFTWKDFAEEMETLYKYAAK